MKHKHGFTIVELLCALTIIGIVSVFATSTLSRNRINTTRHLYSNAYNSLAKAFYNNLLDGDSPFNDDNSSKHANNEDTGTKKLCEALTKYINTVGVPNCSAKNIASEMAKPDDFKNEKIQFIASNGMKFYISNLLGDIENYDPNNKDNPRLKFYLVYVDINGAQKPNSFEYTYTKSPEELANATPEVQERHTIRPDIFAFALLPNGQVCPIGVPEYDTQILTARYAHPMDNSVDKTFSDKPLPYYQAQAKAWGFYKAENRKKAKDMYEKSEIFSYNALIRDHINKKSNIVKNFPDLTALSPEERDKNCSNWETKTCYIFLDRFK